MSTQSLLSILIPIFNVEKYLKECLDSIVKQSLKDIEIICINDGSTDSSLEIIKVFMKNDSRIKLINKSNSGYGDSMNQGLKLASGKYIGIVESDDIADETMFAKLYHLAVTNSFPDIVKSNYYEFWSTIDNRKIRDNIPKHLINKVSLPRKDSAIHLAIQSIWSAIYRRNFLLNNEIYFNPTPGASYQDVSFYFLTLVQAKSVYCTENAYLNYRKDNDNSSVKSKDKVYCVVEEFAFIERYLLNHNVKDLDFLINSLKFEIYLRNYHRIDLQYKLEFLKYFRDEFIKENTLNLIDINYFPKLNIKLLKSLLHSEQLFMQELENHTLDYLIPLCKKLEFELKELPYTSVVLYGFNDLAKKMIQRNKWNIIEIIDRNQAGDVYNDISIQSILEVSLTDNKIIIITAVNPIFIQQIKMDIIKINSNIRIISLN